MNAPELIAVRFVQAHSLYNAGEVAGFSADKVAELAKLGVIAGFDREEPKPYAALLGSDAFAAVIDLGEGRSVQLGDVVRQAQVATGLNADDWNALEQPWRDAAIAEAIEKRRAAPAPAPGKRLAKRNTA
jgi:hypothetical protein